MTGEKAKLDWFSGKVAPTLIALLCVGAIGTGINMARALDRLIEKVDQIQERNERRDTSQDARLNRHDARITYLERQRQASWETLQ